MYRNWFEGIYQEKNFMEARVIFENDAGEEMAGLTKGNIGDDITLFAKDGLTHFNHSFKAKIVGIRFSTEVWYDVAIKSDGMLYRVNRIRGSAFVLDKSPLADLEEDLTKEEVCEIISEATVPIPKETKKNGNVIFIESEPLKSDQEYVFSRPRSFFGKKLFMGCPEKSWTSIKHLFLCGKMKKIKPVAQIGDSVNVVCDGEQLVSGVISEIRVEDEFYYSVAVPVSKKGPYVVLEGLDESVISLL